MINIILAGGRGTRLGDVGKTIPKALVEIAGRPLISYVMQRMGLSGVILGGYRWRQIANDPYLKDMPVHWEVHDTGFFTQTASRVKQWIEKKNFNGRMLVTYCDSIANIDLSALEREHEHARAKNPAVLATLTAVRPISRFGELVFGDEGEVKEFKEKQQQGCWINGGYIVMESEAFKDIYNDGAKLEDLLQSLASKGQLAAYKHKGAWYCVDSMRDMEEFEKALEEEKI